MTASSPLIVIVSFLFLLALADRGCLVRDPSEKRIERPTNEIVDRTEARQCDWKIGTVFGLTPGKSTRGDVQSRFGKAKWEGSPEDRSPGDEELIEMEYHDVDRIEPKWEALAPKSNIVVTVFKASGIVKVVTIYPNDLNKSSVDSVLGVGQSCLCKLGESATPDDVRFPKTFNYDAQGLIVNVRKDDSVIYFEFTTECQ